MTDQRDSSAASAGPGGKRPGYRRKWKRRPVEHRRTAAASLADVFAHSKVRATLWVILAASAVVHAIATPFVGQANRGGANASGGSDTYIQKVMQKERAKRISKEIKGRITMPPPPADPEAVIEGTFKESLSSDVEKLVGDMLDASVVKRLADSVQASLEDELAEVSRDIVEGKMSEEEIRKLHEQFRRKAHDAAIDELMKYREETQIQRAAMSTTEWYEREMSPTLLGNINYALLHQKIHSRGLWYETFGGRYSGWTRFRNWASLRSDGHLRRKIADLDRLRKGPIDRRTRKPSTAWPGPGIEQAKIVDETLKKLHAGTIRMSNGHATYPTPSWKSVIYGDIDEHHEAGRVFEVHMCDGILSEFWPHKEDEMIQVAEALDGLWDHTLNAAASYRVRAEAGADAAELARLRDACFQEIDAIGKEARKLLRPDRRLLQEINWCARVGVLTGEMQPRMHKYWIDEMVSSLEPLIRKIARGQFEKGIIVHKAGVDEAMKEFTEKVVPLLRRDLERMVSARKFRRLIWTGSGAVYKTPGGEQTAVPSDEDVAREAKKLAGLLKDHPDLKPYADRRREINAEYFQDAIDNTRDAILTAVHTGGLLLKQMYVFVEGVDYADKVKEKLDARLAAAEGRGQDVARLTRDGLPDTQAPLVALFFGASKGQGAGLEPVATTMRPAFYNRCAPECVLQWTPPRLPGGPGLPGRKGILPQQAKVAPAFSGPSPRFEAIPFLYKFPRLDGDLSDWGEIRPLVLRGGRGRKPVLVYMAWSYQGFFLGYHVDQPAEQFYWPAERKARKGMSQYQRDRVASWPFQGDHFRLLFDTLDARQGRRGLPNTQEFTILPRGTDTMGDIPGTERKIESTRDAETKEWRGVKALGVTFPTQPADGPDGSGPYRVTKVTPTGYTVEVFLPRTLFEVPIFAPGWYIGFDCAVAAGYQGRGRGRRSDGQFWADPDTADAGNRGGNRPDTWGDVLMLGTDPRFLVQNADPTGRLTRRIVPGHSYLLTVVDPDRNVSLSQEDTVLVSAEAEGGDQDVEVFILKETEANSGIFRGYVNTAPGAGRKVQGVLEVMPGQEVVFGYVDLADARGARNAMTYVRLPVVAAVMNVAARE